MASDTNRGILSLYGVLLWIMMQGNSGANSIFILVSMPMESSYVESERLDNGDINLV